MRNRFGILTSAAALWLAAGPGMAQEVRLEANRARDALSAASLLLALDADAPPQDFIAAARADYRRLLTALYAEGYYGGSISITVDGAEAAGITPLAAPEQINRIVITVDSGPAFRFGTVEIAPLPALTELREDPTLTSAFLGSERARSGTISAGVDLAIEGWRATGYPQAAISSQTITARHQARRLDVRIRLDPGPLLTFGPLAVRGAKTVSDDRIREIAGLPTGRPYAPDEINRAGARLRRTGTFSSVSMIEAAQAGPDDTLTITAELSDAKPRRFGAGIELASVEGLTLSGFWLHRNFLGGAERMRVDGQIAGISGETGGVDYSLGGSFTRPATLGADTDYLLSAEIAREDEPDYRLDKIALETGLSRRVSDTLTVSGAFGLLRAEETTGLETRTYTLYTLPLEAVLDERDNPADARAGGYAQLEITPFRSYDGTISGSRFAGDARSYLALGEAAPVTLAGRLQLGRVFAASAAEAPADFLFYSGGSDTVRGQGYQSLGVSTTSGGATATTGGTAFAGGQFEARLRFAESFALVGFYDIGQVGSRFFDSQDTVWHAGAGLGLRYETGIGPLRLDLATQASGADRGEDLQVYIGIGQAF